MRDVSLRMVHRWRTPTGRVIAIDTSEHGLIFNTVSPMVAGTGDTKISSPILRVFQSGGGVAWKPLDK